MTGDDGQELRALALQTTAEVWRGLDVLEKELKLCRFASALDTLKAVRECVKLSDVAIIELATQHREATNRSGLLLIPEGILENPVHPEFVQQAFDAMREGNNL